MSKALYRKYRSKKLDEVIGQRHVTDILSRAISQGRVSHAYLLSGPRGVGKTSVARILAHEINNLEYCDERINLDIIEIDAASNNGVEDVRDLREKVQIAPVSSKKKIYIIDEVHMLSKAAFNALLKTLEEPPAHVVFILATTNIEKLPATIVSRTQRFSFRPISIDDVVNHLSHIAKQEKIKISDEALKLIAEHGEGSFRDSISLLDQLSSLSSSDKDEMISAQLIEDTLGLAPNDTINQLIVAVENHDIDKVIKLLNGAFDNGINAIVLISQITNSIRALIPDKPQLLPLLDQLIDANRSPQPQLKLLSVLGLAALPKKSVKSVALAAPVREISASIEKLQKQSTPIGSAKKAPQKQSTRTNKTIDNPVVVDISNFDWDKLISYTRENYVALYSVLSKCNYQLSDDCLTLYTGNNFYKKKLDDPKYSPLLSKCLQEIGVNGLDINTIPTTPPPKDSQAAAIAAIMGGGEEVSLESV
jgi:DNA polymerase-3 subunit gamma/tau